jgi:phosphate transport system permease protein
MSVKQNNLKTWFKSGTPWIWMNAGAVSIAVIMTLGLLTVIAVRGLGHFWPADVVQATYQIPGQEARLMAGEISRMEEVPRARLAASGMPVDPQGGEFMTRELFKVGNRDLFGADFTWVVGEWLSNPSTPENLTVLERREWGNFYGYLVNVKENGELIAEGDASWPVLKERIERIDQLHKQLVRIEKKDIGRINAGLERIRLQTRKLELQGKLDEVAKAELAAERAQWDAEYKVLETKLIALNQAFNRDSVTLRSADGREITLTLGKVVRAFQPNAMGLGDKIAAARLALVLLLLVGGLVWIERRQRARRLRSRRRPAGRRPRHPGGCRPRTGSLRRRWQRRHRVGSAATPTARR